MIIQPGVHPETNYSFDAGAGTVTFLGKQPPSLESVLTISNYTSGGLLFQPQGGSAFTGTWSAPILTLAADTSGMSNTDSLFILFDDGQPNVVQGSPTGESLPVSNLRAEDLLAMLMRIVKMLESNSIVDNAQRQRIIVDSAAAVAVSSLPTLATVTTVGTATNVGTVGAVTAIAGMDREQYINIARNAYANSIRSQLNFQ
jgi:hypothetical protein